jgi:predicted alpha/beta hydrolase family esterase
MLVYREIRQRKLVYHARNAAYEERQKAKHEAEAREAAAAKGEPLPPPPPPPELPVPPRPEKLAGEWLAIPAFGTEADAARQSLLSLHFRPRGDDDFWYYRLSFFNHDFVRAASRRRLAAQPGRERPRYYFWKQPEPDPESPPRREKLALILPGIGGAWDAPVALALAEMFYRAGYDVANFDSAFHWYFMKSSGANLRLPGFLPEDAAAVKVLLCDALEDLHERGDVKDPYTVLVGYSMGGMHALKIAATDRAENRLKLDRVLAINPPAELRHALKRAEEFARQGGHYSVREAVDRIVTVGGALLTARAGNEDVLSSRLVLLPPLGAPDAPPVEHYLPDLTSEDAQCLVGMNLGSALRKVLLTAHRERPLRELETPFAVLKRNQLYREIDAIGFSCYAEKILAGEYPGVPLEELYRMSSLGSFEKQLADDPRLRVLHSWNDPLLTDDDARHLDRIFGKRIVWSSGGGHLGNLCADAVQHKIIELADPPEEPAVSPDASAERSAAPAEPAVPDASPAERSAAPAEPPSPAEKPAP